MAATETTVPMDDKELFSSAMADEPARETAEERPAETDGQPRDEHGRFAPKEATVAEAAPLQQPPLEQKTEAAPEPKVEPAESPGVRQLREAHERAERRAEEARFQSYTLQQQLQQRDKELAELRKPKAEPVDFFSDPNAALQQSLSPIQQEFNTTISDLRLDNSRLRAEVRHGVAAVDEMEKAIGEAIREQHPDMAALGQRMKSSNDPVGVAMQWFQNHKLVKETGGDLAAYKQRLLDEAMKDPAFQAKVIEATRTVAGQQQQGARPVVQLPPSLNKATGAGLSNTADDGDMSDAALFRHATAPGRR